MAPEMLIVGTLLSGAAGWLIMDLRYAWQKRQWPRYEEPAEWMERHRGSETITVSQGLRAIQLAAGAWAADAPYVAAPAEQAIRSPAAGGRMPSVVEAWRDPFTYEKVR